MRRTKLYFIEARRIEYGRSVRSLVDLGGFPIEEGYELVAYPTKAKAMDRIRRIWSDIESRNQARPTIIEYRRASRRED